MRYLVPSVAPLVLVLALFAALTPASRADPPGKEYKIVWHDEFDGKKLNLKKWEYRGLGPRHKGINVKKAVQFDDRGHLFITQSKVNGEFHTGMIGTQNTLMFRYGYAEARIRFQQQPGHWSAFWLQTPTINKPPFSGAARRGAEIDIVEYLRRTPDMLRTNLHWDGYGKLHKHIGHNTKHPGLGKGFHTIGIAWTPKHYVFYLDGEKSWQTDRAVSQRTQYFILSDEIGHWGGDIHEANLPDHVTFDYVRLYQNPNQKGNILKRPSQDENK